MTAYRFVTLTCDQCGEIWDGESVVRVTEAREHAAAAGWRYKHRHDLCPRCLENHPRPRGHRPPEPPPLLTTISGEKTGISIGRFLNCPNRECDVRWVSWPCEDLTEGALAAIRQG